MKIGIDFGTTNSAVAVVGADGRPQLVHLAPGEPVQRTVIHGSLDGPIRFGNAAFQAYLDEDLTGRFLRSLKAFLPEDVPKTLLGGKQVSFTELVTAYLHFLVERTEAVLGERITEVVVGRPVHFHADPEKNALAEARLATAITDAGVPGATMQLEPVAAAYAYEQGLTQERTVLVGDFGGGTADFAVFRAGPDRAGALAKDRLADVLGTSGVAAAGDALDARFMDVFLMAPFGKGAQIRARYTGALEDWDHPVLRQIQRLYSLHLLRSRSLEEALVRLESWMVDPRVVRRLRRLVFDDLGYPMAWAIEAAKRELSTSPVVDFRFDAFYNKALDLVCPVDLDSYAAGCTALLDRYQAAIDEVLVNAAVPAEAIDDVFLTGGTSQLPFIRGLFATRFGEQRLRSADAFTTVCEGLAVTAGR